jgi:trigger factor
VKAIVEPLEGNKVKVSVEVDEVEFDKALDSAFRALAREVRIPGFRPGKAPRRILEARFGSEAARGEALRQAIPEYYFQAVREHEVDPIAPPDIDITAGEEQGAISFDAVVEIRPTIEVEGYDGLRVEIPSPHPTEEEIQGRIDALRGQHAELVDVERPAADDDFVTIDVQGSQGGEPIAGLTVEDYLYLVGSDQVVPELDEALRGASAGDERTFDARPASLDDDDDDLHFEVQVKGVKERVLPDLTDEWVASTSELSSVQELRADVTRRIQLVRVLQAQVALREQAAVALSGLVHDEVPDALVNSEVQNRAQDLVMRLQAQGTTVDQYLAMTGRDQVELTEELKAAATQAVKADLALRAVAAAVGITVDDDEVDAEIERVAQGTGQKPAVVRRDLERNEAIPALRSDLRNRKALEWVVEHAAVVDPEGVPIDRADLEAPTEPTAPTDQGVQPAPDSTEISE